MPQGGQMSEDALRSVAFEKGVQTMNNRYVSIGIDHTHLCHILKVPTIDGGNATAAN